VKQLRVVQFTTASPDLEVTFEVRVVEFDDVEQPLRHSPIVTGAPETDRLFQQYLDCLAAFRLPVIKEADFRYLDMDSGLSQRAASIYTSQRKVYQRDILLMLGDDEAKPSLLVTVKPGYNPTNFEFWVVNGVWKGKLADGILYTYDHGVLIGSHQSDLKIICDNQDRLRGDYNDVFANFANVNYVGKRDIFGESLRARMGIGSDNVDISPCEDEFDDQIPF